MREPRLSRMLLEAFRALDEEVEAALRDRGLDLRPTQARALLLVDRTGTRLTELALRARLTKQRMMQVVDELEGAGLLRRAPDPTDARAKVVKPTARGLRSRAEVRRAMASVESRVRRQLGERRFRSLTAALVELTGGRI
ncbi:MAG TPA: MarR family transcriptional regulator [Actinomycetota bacterium]|nr:MarR family transcriptional regulator [Actinomycetota bacterium]